MKKDLKRGFFFHQLLAIIQLSEKVRKGTKKYITSWIVYPNEISRRRAVRVTSVFLIETR